MARETLSQRSVLILASIADAERHGYAIKKDIAARTAEEVRIGPTSLYRLIRELLEKGLIEESSDRPVAHLDDERRRYFRITAEGRRALAAELRRLQQILTAVKPSLAPRSRT